MSTPSITLLENAANATFWSSTLTTAFGLSQMTSSAGKPLEVETANGCTAAAFTDGAGHVIVAFQGTTTAQQSLADVELMGGTSGSQIPAFQDALAFTKSVEQAAAAKGIAASNVYVTGHSLGGTLAEYVALQTGLGGASFAGSGVPGYQAAKTVPSNFVSFVAHGDAFANWSTDGSEHVLLGKGIHEDHYGQMVFLGPSSADSLTNTIISDYQALAPSLFDGNFMQAAAKLSADFTNNLLTVHSMSVYQPDISALAMPAPSIPGSNDTSSSALSSFLYSSS